jgi:hypothetical protein
LSATEFFEEFSGTIFASMLDLIAPQFLHLPAHFDNNDFAQSDISQTLL